MQFNKKYNLILVNTVFSKNYCIKIKGRYFYNQFLETAILVKVFLQILKK